MKASDLIILLRKIVKEHGDLPVFSMADHEIIGSAEHVSVNHGWDGPPLFGREYIVLEADYAEIES